VRGTIEFFEGLSLSEVWSFVRFYVFLWTSITKHFCNYLLGLISLDLRPFL